MICHGCGQVFDGRTGKESASGLRICPTCIEKKSWVACSCCGKLTRKAISRIVTLDAKAASYQIMRTTGRVCSRCWATKTRRCGKCKIRHVTVMFNKHKTCKICEIEKQLIVATNPKVTQREALTYAGRRFYKYLKAEYNQERR